MRLDEDLRIRPKHVDSYDGDENFGKKVEQAYGVWLDHHAEYCQKVAKLMNEVGDEAGRKAQISLLVQQYRELAYASEKSKYDPDEDLFSPEQVLFQTI